MSTPCTTSPAAIDILRHVDVAMDRTAALLGLDPRRCCVLRAAGHSAVIGRSKVECGIAMWKGAAGLLQGHGAVVQGGRVRITCTLPGDLHRRLERGDWRSFQLHGHAWVRLANGDVHDPSRPFTGPADGIAGGGLYRPVQGLWQAIGRCWPQMIGSAREAARGAAQAARLAGPVVPDWAEHDDDDQVADAAD